MFHRQDITFSKPAILSPQVQDYITRHTSPICPELEALAAQTKTTCPEWADIMSSPVQASLLAMLIRWTGVRRVLEVGTFTGFSAVNFACAIPHDGHVITVDNFAADRRARVLATEAFARSAHGNKITLVEEEARTALRQMEGPFDLIFIDADKPNYIDYYETILGSRLLADDGLIVIDNTLWGGLAATSELILPAASNERTRWVNTMLVDWADHVRSFNAHVNADPRVENVMLSVADGMTLIRLSTPAPPRDPS
jgi:caffeoyl-CoA O-methyltransferase